MLEVPRRWLGAFDVAFEELTDDTTLANAIRSTSLAVANHIDEHRDTVRAAYAVLAGAPSLQSSTVATTA